MTSREAKYHHANKLKKVNQRVVDMIQGAMDNYFKRGTLTRKTDSSIPVGLVSIEYHDHLRRMYGRLLDNLGPYIYHIGGGCITGKGGWKMFGEALQKKGFQIPD